jgi:hypothetical protein
MIATRHLTIQPDGAMKQLPGGARAFSVEVVGAEGAPKRRSFGVNVSN